MYKSPSLLTIALIAMSFCVFGQSQSIDFSVAQGGNYASILSWSSANSELKGFVIEKSLNGKDYFQIAVLENKSVNGSHEAYGFVDDDFSETTTYRLKEVTRNELEVFQEVEVAHSSTHNIEIYPNPVSNDHVSLSGPASMDFKLFMTDANGSIIARSFGSLSNIETVINHQLPSLDKAIYFVRLEGQHGASTLRLVKQ